MDRLKLLLFIAFAIQSCQSSKHVISIESGAIYRIVQLDSLSDVYIIHATKNDSVYKMVQLADGSLKTKLIVDTEYRLGLKSLFVKGQSIIDSQMVVHIIDITPNVHGVTGAFFHGLYISIDTDIPNEKWDLFEITYATRVCDRNLHR